MVDILLAVAIGAGVLLFVFLAALSFRRKSVEKGDGRERSASRRLGAEKDLSFWYGLLMLLGQRRQTRALEKQTRIMEKSRRRR